MQPHWEGSCLTAARRSLEAQISWRFFLMKSIVKEVNMVFVLIRVKWVELSWKIAIIFNYQVKI